MRETEGRSFRFDPGAESISNREIDRRKRVRAQPNVKTRCREYGDPVINRFFACCIVAIIIAALTGFMPDSVGQSPQGPPLERGHRRALPMVSRICRDSGPRTRRT